MEEVVAALSRLSLSSDPKQDLHLLKAALLGFRTSPDTVLPRGVDLKALFDAFNTSDNEQVELAVQVMSQLLPLVSPQESLERFKAELLRGFHHPAEDVRRLVLKQLLLCVECEAGISSISSDPEMLHSVLKSVGDASLGVVKLAIKVLVKVCGWPAGLSAVFSQGSQAVLQEMMAQSDSARFNVYEIMEGTDNMILVSKMWDGADQEIYECILRTILNTVQSCFSPTTHKRDALDAKVLDRLCTATAPSIIVSELQNRRVNAIEEEKLILALCKFCEGSSECNNLTFSSFSEPPTFLGRAWMQLIECGGVALLVTLLLTHRTHPRLRPALLRAMLGVEHNYSYRDTILKHMLAAKLLPQLAEQFDELMAKYMEVRRESLPGKCIHTTQTGGGDPGGEGLKQGAGQGPGQKGDEDEDSRENKMEVDEDDESKKQQLGGGEGKESSRCGNGASQVEIEDKEKQSFESKRHILKQVPSSSSSQSTTRDSTTAPLDILLSASTEIGGFNNARSPSQPASFNPHSPDSLSCSPHSYQSSSGHGSPTSYPPHGRSESPTFSPPVVPIPQCATSLLPLWNVESSASSSTCTSPPHSPTIGSPTIGSPLRSMSPIRVPSDWEYEEEEEREQSDEDGRFSPTVLESKLSELEESQTEELEEESSSMEEDTEESKTLGDSTEAKESDTQSTAEDRAPVFQDLQEDTSPLSPGTGKRARESPSLPSSTPHEKKIKPCSVTLEGKSEGEETEPQASSRDDQPVESEVARVEQSAGGEAGKSPFVKLNQIKFRVRKKGLARRQLSLVAGDSRAEVYTPHKDHPPGQETLQQRQQQTQQAKGRRRRSDSFCSPTVYSDLSMEEAQSLELLELVVRIISQVAHVKEAIKPVCREFVPRIMTYLSKAQVIHKSATRMLVTIARNPLCIQPLLDSLFIPYVGVELGEAGDPESPSGCLQCRILSEGSTAFLDQMVNFFNHIHQYGQCEVSSRLHPSRDPGVREGCVMALPHITRCPKLLHDFMVCYPAIDLLMKVLHSPQPPSQASYMYATAALSRLASTLQLENQFKPVRCEVCYRREGHTREEVAAQLKNRRKTCGQTQRASHPPPALALTAHPEPPRARECKWVEDEARDVTFTLKDGSSVSANRESLAAKNEVLRGMLLGSFSEGSSPSVELPWTSRTSVEMLIHFLHGCRCAHMENGSVEAYTELVLMSQMYMVEDLQAYAEARMISAIGDWEDIIRIYESGVGRINESLILQALCTALVKPMKTWKRARWIKELFQSPHAEDIDYNIRMIIHHPLDMNRLVCNCDQSLSLYMVSESEYTKLC